MSSETATQIKVSDIVYRKDLYPRFKPNPSKIQEYSENFDKLPPIEINQDGILMTHNGYPVMGENGIIKVQQNNFIVNERGEIIARFVAESEQVKAILEGNMQLLKDSLQKSGVMVQSLEVSVGQQGGEQQRNWNNKQNEGLPLAEPKTSALQQRVLRQPAYGYGDTAAGYYSAESSEIDLTA